jgi:SSS family solute:Na+ symporter
LAAPDLIVIVAFLGGSLALGLVMRQRARSAEDYFLGARRLPAWAVMLSIVATETSALTVISVPGIAARGDYTFLQLALGYLVGRIAVAWWLLPGYFAGRQQTAYERLAMRFGTPTRQALSATFLGTRLLADGVRIYAGAIPLALLTGWDLPAAIVGMGLVTLAYTFVGGLRSVVWADALQWAVYIAGGACALWVALQMATEAHGSWGEAFARAEAAGKLHVFDLQLSASVPFTLLGGLVGGALLSAASHGTDHLVVQRLLATRTLRAAQWALVGSGVLVLAQFALFLAIGTALWAAGQAPEGVPGDSLFPAFIVQHLPSGIAGLLMAGILAAAMSTISSSISALASSTTQDLYAPWAGKTAAADGVHLLRVGRWCSLGWGLLLTGCALAFHFAAGSRDTPVVVMALSIASVTYGALLGSFVLAQWRSGAGARVQGPAVVAGAALSMGLMAALVFGLPGRVAFVWFVPLGTGFTIAGALAWQALATMRTRRTSRTSRTSP